MVASFDVVEIPDRVTTYQTVVSAASGSDKLGAYHFRVTYGETNPSPHVDERPMADPLTKADLDAALIAASKARSGAFAWREWAVPAAMTVVVGLGLFNFNERLATLETRLHDDFEKLSDKIGALAVQQAHDEGPKKP